MVLYSWTRGCVLCVGQKMDIEKMQSDHYRLLNKLNGYDCQYVTGIKWSVYCNNISIMMMEEESRGEASN